MKKSLLLLAFFLLVIVSNSQTYIESKVLEKFFLGYDSEKEVAKDLEYDYRDGSFVYDNGNIIKTINIYGYARKSHACNLVIVLVNDVLYQITYYPLRNKDVIKYIDLLDSKYSRDLKYPDGITAWSNKTITIVYNIKKDYTDFFAHYNNKMLLDYPQYKDYKY